MSGPSVMMLCGVCGVLMTWETLGCEMWCPWELKVAGPRCTSPGLGDVSAQRVVVTACPWCMGDPNITFTESFSPGPLMMAMRIYQRHHWYQLPAWSLVPSSAHSGPPSAFSTWSAMAFSAPLGQTSTTQCLHLEGTFSGGFPRLLTLSNVLSQSSP